MQKWFLLFLDERTKGFSDDGKFERTKFKSVYSLSHNVPESDWGSNVKVTAMILACVAKYSSLFGTKLLRSKSSRDLVRNEDVLFVGALLLRLSKIYMINKTHVSTIIEVTEGLVKKSKKVLQIGRFDKFDNKYLLLMYTGGKRACNFYTSWKTSCRIQRNGPCNNW